MNARFLVTARDEFRAAVSWYDEREAGLGDRFTSQVQATVRRICADPQSYEFLGNFFHRCGVTGFP